MCRDEAYLGDLGDECVRDGRCRQVCALSARGVGGAGMGVLRVAHSAATGAETEDWRGLELGEKIPPNYLHGFMFFLTVLASRPFALGNLAICCEYHTSDMSGRCFRSALYAFCQAAYMAWVLSFRVSRFMALGV